MTEPILDQETHRDHDGGLFAARLAAALRRVLNPVEENSPQ
jgi:hypothetical protein